MPDGKEAAPATPKKGKMTVEDLKKVLKIAYCTECDPMTVIAAGPMNDAGPAKHKLPIKKKVKVGKVTKERTVGWTVHTKIKFTPMVLEDLHDASIETPEEYLARIAEKYKDKLV